jgi:hypothetical protein
MTERMDYTDNLRAALLALALIPVAGLQTASYWLRESLERASSLATDVITTTALARKALPAIRTDADPIADVLAQDLLDAGRAYVRSMVRLPADSAIYFTGELERRLNALLQRIQPDAATDLGSYVDGELQRVLLELDRLSVVARAEAGRTERTPTVGAQKPPPREVIDEIDELRKQTKGVRDKLAPRGLDKAPVEARDDGLRALDLQKARTKLQQALDDSATFLREDTVALEKVRALIEYLKSMPSPYPSKEAR